MLFHSIVQSLIIFSVAPVICEVLADGTDNPGGVLLLPVCAPVSPLLSAESTICALHIFLIFIALCELNFLNLCTSVGAALV